jgi:hypothetical protein
MPTSVPIVLHLGARTRAYQVPALTFYTAKERPGSHYGAEGGSC